MTTQIVNAPCIRCWMLEAQHVSDRCLFSPFHYAAIPEAVVEELSAFKLNSVEFLVSREATDVWTIVKDGHRVDCRQSFVKEAYARYLEGLPVSK